MSKNSVEKVKQEQKYKILMWLSLLISMAQNIVSSSDSD